jgi:8-oxo-dGTP pyrophosphatase MutT (NUDIX family)
LLTRLLHAAVRAFQSLRRSIWFFSRPVTHGVHALPLTPEGRIVLVTLSYAHGWRLPGGGRKAGEDPEEAMLRELREEIGMSAHGSIREVGRIRHRPDFRDSRSCLFIVEGVRYRPRWSLEVKKVSEFYLDNLPDDTARITRRMIAAALGSEANRGS